MYTNSRIFLGELSFHSRLLLRLYYPRHTGRDQIKFSVCILWLTNFPRAILVPPQLKKNQLNYTINYWTFFEQLVFFLFSLTALLRSTNTYPYFCVERWESCNLFTLLTLPDPILIVSV